MSFKACCISPSCSVFKTALSLLTFSRLQWNCSPYAYYLDWLHVRRCRCKGRQLKLAGVQWCRCGRSACSICISLRTSGLQLLDLSLCQYTLITCLGRAVKLKCVTEYKSQRLPVFLFFRYFHKSFETHI